jgi:hypothetical protein
MCRMPSSSKGRDADVANEAGIIIVQYLLGSKELARTWCRLDCEPLPRAFHAMNGSRKRTADVYKRRRARNVQKAIVRAVIDQELRVNMESFVNIR